MTDLNLQGPALKLVHRYLGQPDVPDADKIAFAAELMALVVDHQPQIKQQLQAAMHKTGIRVDAATMLRLAAVHLVREMMTLPVDADVGVEHLRHCIVVADSIVAIAEANGYWTIPAEQARMDVKSARQRVATDANLSALYVEIEQIESGDWGPEDARLVVHALVADVIDLMPQDKLERVLEAAKRIRDE